MLKILLIGFVVASSLAKPQSYSPPTRSFGTDPFALGLAGGSGRFPISTGFQRGFGHTGSSFALDSRGDQGSRRGFGRGPLSYDGETRLFSRGFGLHRGVSSRDAFSSLRSAAILRDDREENEDGSYRFAYETEDGVAREEVGTPGANGAIVQQGSYSFTFPDGTPGQVTYIADENGYRAQSDLIPVAPEHALAQVDKAEQERAAGVLHDGQYREEDHFGDLASPFQSSLLGTNRHALSSSRRFLGSHTRGFQSPFSHAHSGVFDNRRHGNFLRQGIHRNSFNKGIHNRFLNEPDLTLRGAEDDGDYSGTHGVSNVRNFEKGPYD